MAGMLGALGLRTMESTKDGAWPMRSKVADILSASETAILVGDLGV